MKLNLLTLFVLFLNAANLFGQGEACSKSTQGTDFWFGFMEGRTYDNTHYNEITVTSNYNCNYQIFIGKSVIPITGSVLSNIPVKIRIDWRQVEAIGSENIQAKAIHLVSDNPLNVYALNFSTNSSEVALIFPTISLGNEYYAMCYDPHISIQPNGNAQGKNSEFLIAASEDSTTVTIKPSKVTDKLRPANIPFQVKLNKGEVYQVQSANLANLTGQGDLTGSYITSDKPIALFSGSYSTTIPLSSTNAWDHLYEQMPPLQTWGRKFITVPLKSRHEDTYRVLAAEDNTTIRVGNKPSFILNKGQFSEFMLLYTEPSLIESDKPILVAQFSNSQSVDAAFTGNNGDPFMVIVSPVNQTREKVAFVAYDSPEITSKFFINVIIKDDADGKIKLDNNIVIFTPISGAGYSYAQVPIAKGNHYIESIEPGKGFIAYVYGFGGVEAYGYGVGYNLDIVLDLGSNINAIGRLLVRCDGAPPLTLNAGNAFEKYLWNTGDTTSAIQVTNAGWYKVTASIKDGCTLVDSVEVRVSKPVIEFGPDTTICNPSTIILDAGARDQFTTYSWTTPQSPLTDRKITAAKSGTYSVLATNIFGCQARDSIKVSFVDVPKIDLSKLETLICGKFATTLDISSDKTVSWQLGSDPRVNISGLHVSVLPADFGTYPFTLKAKDQFSCSADTSFRIGFYKIPKVDFSTDVKKCSKYNLFAKYEGDADTIASNFKWVFRGDVIANQQGLNALLVPLGINRPQRDLLLTVTQNGCSDSASQNIIVIPNLYLPNDVKLGCEPFNASFNATNTETVDYYWDFGDGTPVEKSDSVTSHQYQNAGFYNVKFKVVTREGCANEIKIDSLVHVAPIPTVGFTSLPAECLDRGDHDLSYLGTGDSLDRYFWDLSKLDMDEIVKNPARTQGPLVFNLKNKPATNIGLSVVSKYGCKSDTAGILVKRIPDFLVSMLPNAGCTPLEPLFTGTVADPVDQLTYNWDFGDGTTGTGDQVKHEYPVPNRKYNIILTASSSITGCSDTLMRKDYIWAYPKPGADFNMDHNIVYKDAPRVKFLNMSIGDKEYAWDFGDGATSDLKDPSHDYLFTGYRTVLLKVFNEYLCSDTTSKTLLVAFDRIFPPTGFSPNAPNPIDREFKLGSEGIALQGYHLTILSRWNDIVFEVKDEIKGWDGRINGGSLAPAGVYLWVLNFTDFLGRRHRQNGTVTLVY